MGRMMRRNSSGEFVEMSQEEIQEMNQQQEYLEDDNIDFFKVYHGDISKALKMAIQNGAYNITKNIILNYKKRDEALKLAFESGEMRIIRDFYYPSKQQPSMDIIKMRINRDDFEYVDFILSNNIESHKELVEILCILGNNKKISKFKEVVKMKRSSLKIDDVLVCMSYYDRDLHNFLYGQGAQVNDLFYKQKLLAYNKKQTYNKAQQWKNEWIDNSDKASKLLTSDLVNELKKSVKNESYTVYKGLSWTTPVKPLVGSLIVFKPEKLSSTSTDIKVADFYAKYDVLANKKRNGGMVIKMNVKRDDILVDLRNNDDGDFSVSGDLEYGLFATNQSEIVVKPNTYNATVVAVYD